MRFAILCTLRKDSDPARMALRLRHLEYIRDHREMIVFGGPTIDAQGKPEVMVLVIDAADALGAERFIAKEPYTASGQVFASTVIRPWRR
ncbi:YciI family protein [Gloeobacter violaceus]|uniref:Gsr3810 protein n=1 Tax=Gloeobacter violaceus (strain ATCC 29082 / PCC 7421) TaxID=251221 RepID=Q7NER8_GLOVI|nr:YciI family protein [Gloeobacter violaceus]BAC91751.1 gsr3810 [Gloeobacter violaceus PCC 7421]